MPKRNKSWRMIMIKLKFLTVKLERKLQKTPVFANGHTSSIEVLTQQYPSSCLISSLQNYIDFFFLFIICGF